MCLGCLWTFPSIMNAASPGSVALRWQPQACRASCSGSQLLSAMYVLPLSNLLHTPVPLDEPYTLMCLDFDAFTSTVWKPSSNMIPVFLLLNIGTRVKQKQSPIKDSHVCACVQVLGML